MNLLTQEDKKNIYNVLADAFIEVVKRQEIGKFERKTLSKKVLDGIENAKTMDDVKNFIHDLVKNYPFFQFSEKMFGNEVKEIQEKKVINYLEKFISSQAK